MHCATACEPYALAVVALAGLVFAQSAFQAGPLAASLPIIDPLEPATAVAIGIFAFHDKITTSPAGLTGELLGLIAVIAGIWVLNHSPLVLGMHDTDDLDGEPALVVARAPSLDSSVRTSARDEDAAHVPTPVRTAR